jgi:hypothetical protein
MNDNFWNDTYPSGGNYWSDYSSKCADNFSGVITPQTTGSSDGICDVQYNIDGDSIDYYPLFVDETPPTITNLQPSDNSTTNDNTTTISADYSDQTGVNVSRVLLMVDSVDVTSSATVTTSSVMYTSAFSDGNHTVYIEVRDNSTNKYLAKATWNFTVDTPPTANAGADRNIDVGNTVNFDGSGSTDNIDSLNQLNFTWNITKDGVLIITLHGVTPSYVFNDEGQFEVNLTVQDRTDNVGYDTIIVTVTTTAQKDLLGEYWWILVVVIVAFIIAIALLFFLRKKKKSETGLPPAQSLHHYLHRHQVNNILVVVKIRRAEGEHQLFPSAEADS